MTTFYFLKQVFLIFWFLWFAIVLVTNITDFLKELTNNSIFKRLNFVSTNYQLLVKACQLYPSSPGWLPAFYYVGIIFWQLIITFLFWLSIWNHNYIYIAFTVSLSHWIGFLLMDEIYRQWELERAHKLLFLCQTVTLFLIIYL